MSKRRLKSVLRIMLFILAGLLFLCSIFYIVKWLGYVNTHDKVHGEVVFAGDISIIDDEVFNDKNEVQIRRSSIARIQTIKVAYSYNNKEYETRLEDIGLITGTYFEGDNIDIWVDTARPLKADYNPYRHLVNWFEFFVYTVLAVIFGVLMKETSNEK